MSQADATPASQSVLEHGRRLLAAQRRALVDGHPERLDDATRQLSDWLQALARAPDSPSIAIDELRRLSGALQANATLAAGASAQVERALETLLAESAPTYAANGRPSAARRGGGRFSA